MDEQEHRATRGTPAREIGAAAPAPQGCSNNVADNNRVVEFDGERYLQIRGAWYNARTYIKPPEIISRRLEERFGMARPPEAKPARPPQRPPRG